MKNISLYNALWLLFNGLVISVISAGISIYGMTLIFGGHALVVALMIGSMEVGKLSSATWLKFNWTNPLVSAIHKSYLLLAILILTILSMLGCFGFLSAAHLETGSPQAGLDIQASQYTTQLTQKTQENDRLQKRLDQIDKNVSVFIDKGSASKGLSASNALKKERNDLSHTLEVNNTEINNLNIKLAPIKEKSSLVDIKLGPVKYLAQMMGFKDPETAVRIVIFLILLPFDPLAVVLVLSGMMTLNQWREEQNRKEEEPQPEPDSKPQPEPERGEIDLAFIRDQFLAEPEPDPDFEEVVEETSDVPMMDFSSFNEPKPEPVVEPEPAKLLPDLHQRLEQRSLIKEQLVDLLNENPSIISDLIAVVKDMEEVMGEVIEESREPKPNTRITPTHLTGGTFDK